MDITDITRVEQAITRATRCRMERGAALAPLSTWRIGGACALAVRACDMEDAARVLSACSGGGCALTVAGGGSNLLFDDAGLEGVLLIMAHDPGSPSARIRINGNRLTAGAGAHVSRVAMAAARAGLSGLEHAANIPGTVGGLVVMNGGSNRRSIGETVARVRALDSAGRVRELEGGECGFGYRRSCFQDRGWLVGEVELALTPGDPGEIRAAMERDLAERTRKFPLDLPSCGSVFKSSPGLYDAFGPPGMVIDRLGLKGLREGDIQVSPRHGNFFVNLGKGTSAQVLALVDRVRREVFSATGFVMECEARHVAPDGTIAPLHQRLEPL